MTELREPFIRRDYFSRWESYANMPKSFKLELGYSTWAHWLLEDVLPIGVTPKITRPAATAAARQVLEGGVDGLPEGMMFDQLEDLAVLRGLQAYSYITDQVGTVYRMDTPWPSQTEVSNG